MSLFNELKRRNVIRVAMAYVVAAWLLIQVVETILPAFGYGDAAIRYIVIVLAIAFIPTLVFSWAFEITPEGLKREVDVVREQSITRFTSKKLDRIIMVLLALALGYFAFDKFVLDPVEDVQIAESAHEEGRSEALTESYGDRSIAVLPFVNMSSDPEQEYFSDGVSEELLNLLAKLPDLRVISRSSAFSFKGKDIDIPTIAAQLNVAHILEGSVRKAGNQVRITVQLIEARSDTHLWSETYDRTLDDIFAIQDEIASVVVEALKLTLLDEVPKVKRVNSEAYALYLQAVYLSSRYTAEAYELSHSLYQRALEIDPSYAAAWSGLAQNYYIQAVYGLLPTDEANHLAREAANRALALDPEHASAHAVLFWINIFTNLDWENGVWHLKRALELEPNNHSILIDATSLSYCLGRPDEAIVLGKYVVDRDPVNPESHYYLGMAYLWAMQLDAAIASFRTALTLSPGYIMAHYRIGVALLLKGEPQGALAEMQQEVRIGKRLQGTAMAYYALGQKDESDMALAEMIASYKGDTAYNIAYVLAFRSEADRAFEWLGKAVQDVDVGLAQIVNQPEFINIHDDPRWLSFLKSIGMSPKQLDAIEFKVTLPDEYK
jgi:TolB-like protein/cytochrome c-type biogenesis protein CcmH/NrfG